MSKRATRTCAFHSNPSCGSCGYWRIDWQGRPTVPGLFRRCCRWFWPCTAWHRGHSWTWCGGWSVFRFPPHLVCCGASCPRLLTCATTTSCGRQCRRRSVRPNRAFMRWTVSIPRQCLSNILKNNEVLKTPWFVFAYAWWQSIIEIPRYETLQIGTQFRNDRFLASPQNRCRVLTSVTRNLRNAYKYMNALTWHYMSTAVHPIHVIWECQRGTCFHSNDILIMLHPATANLTVT